MSAGAPTATLVGRYNPTEPPDQDDFQAGARTVVSIPWLINEWKVVTPTTYGGYVVLNTPPAGLGKIQSVKPVDDVTR